MEQIGGGIVSLIEKEERERLLYRLQAGMEKEGVIVPRYSPYPNRLTTLLIYAGGACLACMVSSFTVLLNFLIFIRLLHMEF
jgi:hypothetical protein